MDVSERTEGDLSNANIITVSSSEDPPVDQTNQKVEQKSSKKQAKSLQAPSRPPSQRKCRYTGTYKAKDWNRPSQMTKNVKLRDRLAELEKLISENKDTGILLDYDEEEAQKFFAALGIRRICSSQM